jgi:hypothetical protein
VDSVRLTDKGNISLNYMMEEMRDLQVAAGYNANDKDNNFDYIILLSPMW